MTQKGGVRGDELEALAEDTIGVNFRSLRTVRDLFVRPNAVFRAYAANDRDRYTPGLRIWLALLGVSLLISLIFGGHEALFLNIMENRPDLADRIGALTGDALGEVAEDYADRFGAVQPPLVALMTALSIFLIAAYDKGLRWTARLNITFATLTAGALTALAFYPLLIAWPQYGMMLWPLIWLAYAITLYRGAPGVLGDKAIWRCAKAALFASTALVLVIAAGIGAMMWSLTGAIEENAVEPAPSAALAPVDEGAASDE